MHPFLALSQLQSFLENHTVFMPVAGLACSGLAVALLRAPLDLRPFGVSESELRIAVNSAGPAGARW
jgi:hypothetical protein